MAVQNFSGGRDLYVMIPQTTLSTIAPVAPQTGYEIPVQTYDVSIVQGFEQFNTLNTTGSPDRQLPANEAITGTFDWYLTFDTVPLLMAQLLGGTVSTGAGPDYDHENTLGDQTNLMGEAFALEHHQLQADPVPQYRLAHGLRISTSTLTITPNGGVVFGTNTEGLREALPSTTVVADTVTSFADAPVAAKTLTMKIDTIETPCQVVEFTMQIDHQLDSDVYPVGGGGQRCTMTRGNPVVTGTFNVFFNDSTYAYITAARANPKTTFDFLLEWEESITRYFYLQINSADLAIQGVPIQGSAGYNCNLTYVALGVISNTGNQTATFPV